MEGVATAGEGSPPCSARMAASWSATVWSPGGAGGGAGGEGGVGGGGGDGGGGEGGGDGVGDPHLFGIGIVIIVCLDSTLINDNFTPFDLCVSSLSVELFTLSAK